jgi:hypothetical protein
LELPAKHVFEDKKDGQIEVMGRRGRRCNQLLDDLKENGEYGILKRK